LIERRRIADYAATRRILGKALRHKVRPRINRDKRRRSFRIETEARIVDRIAQHENKCLAVRDKQAKTLPRERASDATPLHVWRHRKWREADCINVAGAVEDFESRESDGTTNVALLLGNQRQNQFAFDAERINQIGLGLAGKC
jgi:hypothetical protein